MTVVCYSRRAGTLLLGAVALFCILYANSSCAQTAEELEAKVKSGFLLNFARYVEWPTNSFSSSNSPIVIGVLGQDSLGRHLDEVVSGKSVETHPVQIRRARRISELTNSHVIFICASERPRASFLRIQEKPILTVSDVDTLTATNGMILLKKKQGTMRFDINRELAEKVGLKISSKLLRLADNYRQ